MNQKLHQEERQQFERLLIQQRIDRVAERMKVLEAFLAAEEHHTAQGLHQGLGADGAGLDQEFITQTLDMLVRFGLATRREFEGGPPRYEHRHLGEHHDHLICTACGGITEFHDPELEALKERAARDQGFHGLWHRLHIYGLCRKCQESRQPAMPLAMASPGEKLQVVSMAGCGHTLRHLQDMGLATGAQVEVISANGGPMVVALGGSRLALGRGVAHKIMVSPLADR